MTPVFAFNDKIVPACHRFGGAIAPIRSNGPVSAISGRVRPGIRRVRDAENILTSPH